MSSPMSVVGDIEKDTKPAERASVETGEVVESTAEYERYLQLHGEFAVDHGAQRRRLLRKRMPSAIRYCFMLS